MTPKEKSKSLIEKYMDRYPKLLSVDKTPWVLKRKYHGQIVVNWKSMTEGRM